MVGRDREEGQGVSNTASSYSDSRSLRHHLESSGRTWALGCGQRREGGRLRDSLRESLARPRKTRVTNLCPKTDDQGCQGDRQVVSCWLYGVLASGARRTWLYAALMIESCLDSSSSVSNYRSYSVLKMLLSGGWKSLAAVKWKAASCDDERFPRAMLHSSSSLSDIPHLRCILIGFSERCVLVIWAYSISFRSIPWLDLDIYQRISLSRYRSLA